MVLMSNTTGREITDLDHVKQSISDILTTPKNTRIMRREYGSDLFLLVDSPMTSTINITAYQMIAEALDRWEPRFLLSKIDLSGSDSANGIIDITLEGFYLPKGETIRLTNIQLSNKETL